MSNAMTTIGKMRRLSRMLQRQAGRLLIAPIDDSLLAGPVGDLEDISKIRDQLCILRPTAVVGFEGTLRLWAKQGADVPFFLNVTASVTGSHHVRKVKVGTVAHAVRLGADGIAAHMNISSRCEPEMIQQVADISRECTDLGMPLLVMAYLRREGTDGDDNYIKFAESSPAEYARRVAHAGRVAQELGADILKLNYHGHPSHFDIVSNSLKDTLLTVAGGPFEPDSEKFLERIRALVAHGADGMSIGRNLYMADDREQRFNALLGILPPLVPGG